MSGGRPSSDMSSAESAIALNEWMGPSTRSRGVAADDLPYLLERGRAMEAFSSELVVAGPVALDHSYPLLRRHVDTTGDLGIDESARGPASR